MRKLIDIKGIRSHIETGRGNSGSVVGGVIWILLIAGLAIGGYLGYKVVPFYYRNLEVRRVFERESHDFAFHENVERTKEQIAVAVRQKFDISIDPRDIYIEKKDSRLYVDGYYTQEVPVVWGTIRLTFEPGAMVQLDRGVKVVP